MISPTAIAYISAMFDCMGAILFVQWFCHVDNVTTKRCSKQSHGCSCQGWKATDHTGTLWNLPNPASGTYTSTHRNSPQPSGTFRNLPPEPTPVHQHPPEISGTPRNPPEPSGTHRNLPELAFGTYTSTHRNPPKSSGTCHRNFPEPAFQNSPEPSSGTCSCDPHRHTPELIWAEDPTSSRCWWKNGMPKIAVWPLKIAVWPLKIAVSRPPVGASCRFSSGIPTIELESKAEN